MNYDNEIKETKFYCFKVRPPWEKMKNRSIITNLVDTQIPNNEIRTSKYTFISFLPLCLMEQFTKMANVYFLVIGAMQTIEMISITNGQPMIFGPLLIVIAISMVKDFFEDQKRRKSDEEENNKICLVFNNTWNEQKWKNLRVGNLVKVRCDEALPADIVVLATSEDKGQCFIETKNLDGESNLKYKRVSQYLKEDMINKLDNIQSVNYKLNYERPSPYLYKFKGSIIKDDNQELTLDQSNLILRGCSLRNTQWVIGVIIYNGHDSKIMLNSVKARPKKGRIEIITNMLIIYIFVIQIIVCFGAAIYSSIWQQIHKDQSPYLEIPFDAPENNFKINTIMKWGNWILIFTNFVPISLLVSIETVKFVQGIFITQDPKTKGNGIKSTVQTSSLNDELGQVSYIFSDKTGTLTKNIMNFKCMTINGNSYGLVGSAPLKHKREPVSNVDFDDQNFFDDLKNSPDQSYLVDFLLCMSLCHTVVSEQKGDDIIYNASSPDELALVYLAKYCGYTYLNTDADNQMTIKIEEKVSKFRIIHIFEFDSSRKRMSIILQNQNDDIIMYTKGADSILEPRLSKSVNQNVKLKTWQDLERYAQTGLRTLLLTQKIIPKQIFNEWNERYNAALNLIDGRELETEKLQNELETELQLIGGTAIEDKLQDNVGETIQKLREAGIQIWVLTGDKVETAINISYSCNLINDEMNQIIIDSHEQDSLTQLVNSFLHIDYQTKQNALIITGESLLIAENIKILDKIMEITKVCKVVVACRVSPKQKSDIVGMVRKQFPELTTLAIGDGANDVNMITAAHIGIGIKGLEGQQAARASDYAIGEFQILQRLLVVHGREAYRKNSILILYNFYKNMLLVLPQFWYAFYNGFSGVSLYDPLMYQGYNLFYTSMPIMLYALFDQQYDNKTLMKEPNLYSIGLLNQLFTHQQFFYWLFQGAIQAMIYGIFCYPIFENVSIASNQGWMGCFQATGTAVLGYTAYAGNLKVLLFSFTHTIASITTIILSIGMFIITYFMISIIDPLTDIGLTFSWLFGQFTYYLITFALFGIVTLLDMSISRWQCFNKERETTKKIQRNEIELGVNNHLQLNDSIDRSNEDRDDGDRGNGINSLDFSKTQFKKRYSGYAYSQQEPLDFALCQSQY